MFIECSSRYEENGATCCRDERVSTSDPQRRIPISICDVCVFATGQRGAVASGVSQPVVSSSGSGSLLHWALKDLAGQDVSAGCGCGARIAEMNSRGYWWCWKNRKVIMGWLQEEAVKRGIQVDDSRLSSIIKAGFREFWRKKGAAK